MFVDTIDPLYNYVRMFVDTLDFNLITPTSTFSLMCPTLSEKVLSLELIPMTGM